MAEELPTEEELRALPRRAIVAYAARCARRVQPLYRSKDERHVQAVEHAIALAERFAKGQPLRVGEASEASLDAAMADVAHADASAGDAARAADRAAFAAGEGAYADAVEVAPDTAAADASSSAGAAYAAYAAAAGAAYAAAAAAADDAPANAAGYAGDARGLLLSAARGDYERLRSICQQEFKGSGDPIDPGDNGPLGPVWSAGPPGGWPAGAVKVQAGTEVQGELARLANEARPAGLVSVYFDDRGFSAKERLLVLKYLAEVYRDLGGTGLKVAGGSTLVPSREEVAP